MTSAMVGELPALAERIKATFRTGEPHVELYADDVVLWHNFDSKAMAFTSRKLVRIIKAEEAALRKALPDYEQRVTRCIAVDGTVVITATQSATLPDGKPMLFEICRIYEITGGKISRVDVWMDRMQHEARWLALRAGGFDAVAAMADS